MSKRKFVPVIIALALVLALAGVLAACDKTEKEGVFAQAGIDTLRLYVGVAL